MDLSQEAFLEAFAHLDDFCDGKPFAPWLYRIVHNRSLNFVKRRAHRSAPRLLGPERDGQTRREPADPRPAPDVVLDRLRLADELKAEVDKLPDKLKGVFVLRYVEDRSVADVARILEAPVNTIKTHLFRARQLLRQRLSRFFS